MPKNKKRFQEKENNHGLNVMMSDASKEPGELAVLNNFGSLGDFATSTVSDVISIYKDTESIKETALRVEMSQVKVRKILLTADLWSSKRSIEIKKLLEKGLSVKEVAAVLGITTGAVLAYMPYSKGVYGEENKSADAISSEQYRERQAEFAARQNENCVGETVPDIDAVRKLVKKEEKHSMEVNVAKINRNDATKMTKDEENQQLFHLPYSISTHNDSYSGEVLKLKLELVGSDEESLPKKEWNILRKYGKVKKSISREILVPCDISLHALHFMIQVLFGWQHSHLYEFTFDEKTVDSLLKCLPNSEKADAMMRDSGEFNADDCDKGNLTYGCDGRSQVQRYLDACGIYFRFPLRDFKDDSWDNDYEKGVSGKTWMRSKYKPLRGFRKISDEWKENQRMVESFKKELKDTYGVNEAGKLMIRVQPSFEEFCAARDKGENVKPRLKPIDECDIDEFLECFEDNGMALRESLCLSEVFYCRKLPGDTTVPLFESPWKDIKKQIEEDAENEKVAGEEYTSGELYRKNAEAFVNFLKQHKIDESVTPELENLFSNLYSHFLTGGVTRIPPVTSTLNYRYDFGDNWEVRITVEDMYAFTDDWTADFENASEAPMDEVVKSMKPYYPTLERPMMVYDGNGNYIDGELYSRLACVYQKKVPLCVAKDGLNVMDDVGNVDGYINFLEQLHEGDKKTRAVNKEWARSQGWTGRDTKPENLL